MTANERASRPGTARKVRAGFMRLIDAAPLIVAARLGFAEDESLSIELERETSWATVRDRIAVAHLDVAHMLAPMPIAANLGLGPLQSRMIAPIALGSGGNTVTVSRQLWSRLAAHGATPDFDAWRSAQAFAAVVAERKASGAARLTMAVVHPHSAHRYQVAYWLAAVRVDLGRDVDLVVVPPPLTAAALAGGQIDAFTAGEPWGSVAVAGGDGAIVTTSSSIWSASPEKVLGVREPWAHDEPDRLAALVRALYRAAVWCDEPGNRDQLARLLAAPSVLDLPAEMIARVLDRRLGTPDGRLEPVDGLLSFAAGHATFPWTSQALWLLAQMIRWGEVAPTTAAVAAAHAAFRPDLYRQAVAPLGVALPDTDSRIEGNGRAAGDDCAERLQASAFFDRQTFDPDQLVEHIAAASGN